MSQQFHCTQSKWNKDDDESLLDEEKVTPNHKNIRTARSANWKCVRTARPSDDGAAATAEMSMSNHRHAPLLLSATHVHTTDPMRHVNSSVHFTKK